MWFNLPAVVGTDACSVTEASLVSATFDTAASVTSEGATRRSKLSVGASFFAISGVGSVCSSPSTSFFLAVISVVVVAGAVVVVTVVVVVVVAVLVLIYVELSVAKEGVVSEAVEGKSGVTDASGVGVKSHSASCGEQISFTTHPIVSIAFGVNNLT